MKICPFCENNSLVFGLAKIKVGRETFKTKAKHCKGCKQVAISPQLQIKIDEWGLGFTKSIIDVQPYFSDDLTQKIKDWAVKFNLSRAEFIKACTTFYIVEMTQAKDFETLRSLAYERTRTNLKENRTKICVPIKYQLFKKIRLYSEVWDLKYESKVVEEAIGFCIAVLDSRVVKISLKKSELTRFVENLALAS